MDQLQPFREAALQRGIPADEVERWIGTARPGITMVPGPGPGPRVAGQLGGHPLLPDGVPHPDLSFAGSLDCAAVPPGATDLDLPPDGSLLYFAEPDLTASPDEAALIYVPAGTPITERHPSTEDVVVFPRSEAHLVIDLGLPKRAEDSAAFPHAGALANVWWDIGHEMARGDGPLQIGGVPWMEQEDPFEMAACQPGDRPENWALIGAWAPEGEGEYEGYFIGELQILIRREDLAARRFDRLSLYWQQQG
jgi:hypothetical protein